YDVYTSSNTSTEIYVQPLWDNSAHATTQAAGCVGSQGSDFYSPAAPGGHAVQIPILSAYEGKGAVCNIARTASTPGALGYPTTEQYPIAGLHGHTFEHGVLFDTGYSVYDVP